MYLALSYFPQDKAAQPHNDNSIEQTSNLKSLILLVGEAGIEPATLSLEG